MSVVVLLFCAVLCILTIKSYFFDRRKAKKLPPLGAGALPVLGHTIMLLCKKEKLYKVFLEKIVNPALKNGTGAVSVVCGTWKCYVVVNPDDGYLLVNSCLAKDPIYEFFSPWLGNEGLFNAEVPVWKRHRKLIIPSFSQSVLDTYLTEFNDHSRKLIKNLSQQVGRGAFDHMPFIKHMMLQLVCATIMGVSLDEQDLTKKAEHAIDTFSGCIVERTRTFWYHNDFIFSFSNLKKQQDEAAKILRELSAEIIRTKKANLMAQENETNECKDPFKSKYKSLLDFLLDLSKDDAFTESEIRSEVDTFIGAGFDTTYHAVCITLLTLGSYPEVQRKVYEEQQEVFRGSDRDVEKQDLSKLKYLEAVLKETMRLYPIATMIGRILDKDLNLKDYVLPAGSRCFMSIYHVGRHPMWGPDADQFRPERWLDGSLPSNTRAFAVFGLGRRNCIGLNYAMMSMKTVLSHVVRRYRISGDVTQVVQTLDVIVTLVSGHHISIERREESKLKIGSKSE